jgi:hypothetical protein
MWTELMWFRVETVEEFVQDNDQLDRSFEKWSSVTKSQGGEISYKELKDGSLTPLVTYCVGSAF